jgi:two-component system, OmpR family, sensor histidine kinase BaeS
MTDYRGQRILGIGNFGWRIVAAFLAIAMATVVVDVVIITVTGTAQFNRFVHQQEVNSAQAAAVAAGVVYEEHGGWRHDSLNHLVSGLERNGASLRITDSSGRPVASSPEFPITPGTPSAGAPIDIAGRRVGFVMLKLDRAPITAEAARLEAERWRWRLIAVGISVLLALGVSLLLSRRITGPIDKVLTVLRARSAGDRDFRIGNVRAPGELGDLLVGLNKAADAVDQQERAQRNLVADVAHELRTPVAVLQAGHEAMLDGITRPTPGNLSSLRDEVLRLSRRLEDLHELASAEAAAMQLRVYPHDLACIGADAAAALADPFDVAGVRLDRQLSSVTVLCDYDRIREVITNLLMNALKYTPAGGEVSLEARPGSGGQAELLVTDTGVGIEPGDLPHVTERFFRGQHSRGMAAGSGLGLTIVAELVKAHHGQLAISSEPGQGTQVTVSLPQAAPAARAVDGNGHRDRQRTLPRPMRRARNEGPADAGTQPRQLLPGLRRRSGVLHTVCTQDRLRFHRATQPWRYMPITRVREAQQ